MELGFLGSVQMGSAIAGRWQDADAGGRLPLFDPNKTVLEPFVAKGGTVHSSQSAVAGAAAWISACLPTRSHL